jgi:hypothetical protein
MAALSRTSPIAPEVGLIAELIAQNTDDAGLTLSPEKANALLRRLDLIRRQIANLEDELGAFRALEDGQAAAAVLDDLCLDVLREAVLDEAQAEARIVYPDFAKGGSNGQS